MLEALGGYTGTGRLAHHRQRVAKAMSAHARCANLVPADPSEDSPRNVGCRLTPEAGMGRKRQFGFCNGGVHSEGKTPNAQAARAPFLLRTAGLTYRAALTVQSLRPRFVGSEVDGLGAGSVR